MISFPPQLVDHGAPVHPAAAWFLPGDGPAAWLAELTQWNVPLENVRFYVVPHALRDRRPCGILTWLEHGEGQGALPSANAAGVTIFSPSPRALPYGLLAEKLFVPVTARLEPPVSDEELRRICVWEAALLHPGCGLIGFDKSDLRRVADLLQPPTQRTADWGRAQPGIRTNPRLLSVVPETPPTLTDLLETFRENIGSEPPENLPAAPHETNLGALDRAQLWLRRKITSALLKLTELGASGLGTAPATPQKPGAGKTGRSKRILPGSNTADLNWFEKFRQRLAARLAAMDSKLEEMRNRELLRLMHLMKTNPDEGLRFALPLGELGAAGRGAAPPGAQLPPRTPQFDLKNLRGSGGLTDAWHVSGDFLENLRKQYRELAQREFNLGRHRRAAYIFAHLLGDHAAAATALEKGRHFREAAVLYRDHLNQPLQAARCLEEGGLLSEAIPLYKQCEMFEKAGDLHTRLEQPEEAEKAYRRALTQIWHKKRDFLATARLLEDKLHAPEEALQVLKSGWPDGAQAQTAACLREEFALLGRLARHTDARRRTQTVRDMQLPGHRIREAADTLTETALHYPDAETRAILADTARVLVGRRLRTAVPAEVAGLLQALRRLAPEDKLLVRDTVRYAARRLPPR